MTENISVTNLQNIDKIYSNDQKLFCSCLSMLTTTNVCLLQKSAKSECKKHMEFSICLREGGLAGSFSASHQNALQAILSILNTFIFFLCGDKSKMS